MSRFDTCIIRSWRKKDLTSWEHWLARPYQSGVTLYYTYYLSTTWLATRTNALLLPEPYLAVPPPPPPRPPETELTTHHRNYHCYYTILYYHANEQSSSLLLQQQQPNATELDLGPLDWSYRGLCGTEEY